MFGNPLHSFRSEHYIWKPSSHFQVRTLHLESLCTVTDQNIVFGNPLHSLYLQVRTLYLETLFTVSGQNIAFKNPLHISWSEHCFWKPSAYLQKFRSEHCIWKPSSHFLVRTFGNPLHIFRSEHCIWKPSSQFPVRTLHLETLCAVSGQIIVFGNPLHSFRSEQGMWKPSAQF